MIINICMYNFQSTILLLQMKLLYKLMFLLLLFISAVMKISDREIWMRLKCQTLLMKILFNSVMIFVWSKVKYSFRGMFD